VKGPIRNSQAGRRHTASAGRELDFSSPESDDFEALSRDIVPVRSMTVEDIPEMIAIDRRITRRDRTAYFRRRTAEALEESGVRVSLVAELDGRIAGFIMARVDFGEFGRTEPEGVIDTIAVDPADARGGIGSALISQLLVNLGSLRVERVRTELAWDNFGLLGFLKRAGFIPSQRLSFARPIGAEFPRP
jgi:ribosomal protein S18 acetylase RimI-like enzyme